MKNEYFLYLIAGILILFFGYSKFYKKLSKGMKLSKNFYLSEFENSRIAKENGILNKVPSHYISSIQKLVTNVLQPVRDAVGFPITINSGYRSKLLNDTMRKKGLGASLKSQHLSGQAADLKSQDNKKVFDYIKDNLEFDQLIWEYGTKEQPLWIHVSYNEGSNRNQVLYIGV